MRDNSPGEDLARLLHGVWRAEPPSVGIEAGDLPKLVPLANAWNVAPLLWPRYRDVDSNGELRAAARAATMLNGRVRRMLGETERRLGEAGIPYLLFKGQAAAAAYTEPMLRRPGSDCDVIVPPGREQEARRVMSRNPGYNVDTVHPFVTRGRVPWEFMLSHSRTQDVCGISLPVLGPEYHLAAVSENLLRHGGCGPKALIDVAALLERFGPEMQWDLLSEPPLRAWVVIGVGLAGALLGADLTAVPYGRKELAPPRWMVREIFRAWAEGVNRFTPSDRLVTIEQTPSALLHTFANRWPLPIAALNECRLLQFPVLAPVAQTALFIHGCQPIARRSIRRVWQRTIA